MLATAVFRCGLSASLVAYSVCWLIRATRLPRVGLHAEAGRSRMPVTDTVNGQLLKTLPQLASCVGCDILRAAAGSRK